MKKRLPHLLLVSVMLIACSYATTAACHDNDEDGYGIGCTGCGEAECPDCNDNDYYINPSRDELCDNGIDDDCDGGIDEDLLENSCTYCADYDNDRYGTPGSTDCCDTQGEGCELSKTDCDNTNPDVNPGAEENTDGLCSDGLDNNCNGLIDEDEPGCAEFYLVDGKELSQGGSLSGGTTGGGPSCPLESPIWVNTDIEVVTEASAGQDIILLVLADSCKGKEVEFSIHKTGGTGAIEEAVGTIEEDNEGNLFAAYITKTPQEKGEYFFKAESTSEVVTSDTLKVVSAAEKECRIEWDCSAIDYGECIAGKKKRDVCPGHEGTMCCSDETSCACTAIYPSDECESYTYARPQSERTCAEVVFVEEEGELTWEEPEEEEEAAEPGFPWILVIGIIIVSILLIGGVIYLLATKKPAVAVPASLLNYVKSARAKNVPDSAIKDALTKSGWKPEQIREALKKAK